MTVWGQLLIISGGNIIFFALQIWYFRWKKREAIPQELHKEIKQLCKDMVTLRIEVARIKGRINGKGWQ